MAWVCKCLVDSFLAPSPLFPCLPISAECRSYQFCRSVVMCTHLQAAASGCFLCVGQSQTGIHRNVGLHSLLTHIWHPCFLLRQMARVASSCLFLAPFSYSSPLSSNFTTNVGHPNSVGMSTHPQMRVGMR